MRIQALGSIAITAIAVGLCAPAGAAGLADFYKGKTVDLLIGYSGGGGYDVYARLLARHMGKHIPGNPNIVPRNMPGAGGLVLANWLYNVANRDGTVFGIIGRGTGFDPLLGNDAAKFDATKYNWIGSMNNEVSVCAAWHTAGITDWKQLRKQEMVVGGTGPSADTDQFPRIMNGVLDTKFKIISGYPGGNDINLAMERGEVQGRCGWSWSSVKSTRWSWYKEGKVKVLIQLSLAKHEDLPNIPLITELADTPDEKQILTLIFSRQALGRPFLAPPAVPQDRAAALRNAFNDTLKDKEFLAEAAKGKLEINPISGDAVQKIMVNAAKTDPKILKKAAAMLKVEKKDKKKK